MPPADDSEIRVLFLSARIQARGSSASTLRLLQRLPELGISVRTISPDAQLVESSRRQALGIQEYPYLDKFGVGNLVMRRVVRDVSGNPPQLLHIQSRRMLSVGNSLAKRLNCPYLVTVNEHLGTGEAFPIDPARCAGVIAVSRSVADSILSQTNLAPDRLHVISSGVETPDLTDSTIPLAAGKVPVVGSAGPLEAIKGFPFLLGAARQVLAAGKDIEFLVAGAGPEEASLRRLARELGIADRVTFVPYILDFAESLAAMDIFVLPSLQQGLGTVMLEAMGLARPVIASDVGGVHGVIRDNENGLTVPPSNSHALALKILELIDQPDRARALGQAARQLVERNYNIDQMVHQTAELYASVLRNAANAVSVSAGKSTV